MYEELSTAPPIFREEYAGLAHRRITQETNLAYRERVAPYNRSKLSRYNRAQAIQAVAVLPLTAIVPIIDLLL